MSSRWYYQMLGEEFGPVTIEQLRELFKEGTLSETDLVRRETEDSWAPMAAVTPSLFAGSGDRPEPAMEEIGDLSELAFEFEDSGPTTRRGAYAEESISDLPPAQDIDLQTSPGNERAEEWYCESFGQILGPMSFDELIELGESGAVDAKDRVRCGARGLWKTVDCLPRVMRAVAAGNAMDVAPTQVSVTAQERSGESASAIHADVTQSLVEPLAEERHDPPSSLSVAGAAAVKPPSPEIASAKSKNTRPGPKRARKTKGDDALLDEIFDDVFSDDSPPARSGTAAQSFAAASASNPPAQTPPQTINIRNSGTAASDSAPASQVASRFAGASLTAAATAARAARSSSKGSGRSFEVNPKAIGILVVVILVAAGGHYVWQHGIPIGSSSGNGVGSFDQAGSVILLRAAMDRYRSVSTNPSESDWKKFSEKTHTEMSALFKSVYDQAGATPNGAACLAATMCLMKIARTKADNKEFIDRNVVEFERQIAILNTK